jgi:hypothetical protein
MLGTWSGAGAPDADHESMVGALLLGGMKRADLPPPPPRSAIVRHELPRAVEPEVTDVAADPGPVEPVVQPVVEPVVERAG